MLRAFLHSARKMSALAETLDDYAAQVARRARELETRRAAWEPKVWRMAQRVAAKKKVSDELFERV